MNSRHEEKFGCLRHKISFYVLISHLVLQILLIFVKRPISVIVLTGLLFHFPTRTRRRRTRDGNAATHFLPLRVSLHVCRTVRTVNPMKHYLFLLLCLLSRTALQAQPAQDEAITWDDFAEAYLRNGDEESDEALTAQDLLYLEYWAAHPRPLNDITRQELLKLPFLTEAQADSLLSYRRQRGGFLAMGELQLVSGMDFYTRRNLSLFLYCDGNPPEPPHATRAAKDGKPWEKFYKGTHEAETRVDLPLYERAGYRVPPQERTQANYYTGNRLHHVVRYRYHYGDEVRYGLTMEKDAGEPVGKRGFYPYDYWSGYLWWQPRGSAFTVLAGDYELHIARGIVAGRSFLANRYFSTSAQRAPQARFTPHTSTDETGYFRGMAASVRRGKWEALAFVSFRRLDATLDGDTVRTFLRTGLHRTLSEIARRRSTGCLTGGLHVGQNMARGGWAFTGLYTHFDHPVAPWPRLYNRYYFRGRNAAALSASYHLLHGRWAVQGELATDHGLHFATEHLIAFRGSARTNLSLQLRHFSPRFVSLWGQALTQGGQSQTRGHQASNEQGLLLNLHFLPAPRWELTAFVDAFRFPKPTYSLSFAGGKGVEAGLRSRLALGARWMLTAQYKVKTKQYNVTGHHLAEYRTKHRLRMSAARKWERGELHAAADASFAHRQTGRRATGGIWSVRGVWKPLPALRFSGLAAAFATDDYDASVYLYEPQLRYASSLPSYFGRGIRGVLTAEWRVGTSVALAVRGALLRYFDRSQIASGTELIDSAWKNDLSLQLRLFL